MEVQLRFYSHDYTASITDLTKAITLQPNDEQAYLFRGITLIALEKYEEAEKDFSRSLQINPTADAYRFRANVRNSLSNPFGAMEDCDSALAFKPNYMEAYCARGEANASIRNYDGAIADLTAALAIEPGNALSLFYRGYANFRKANFTNAIEDFSKLLAIDSTFIYAYNFRGISYSQIDNYSLAIKDYQKFMGENGPDMFNSAYGI